MSWRTSLAGIPAGLAFLLSALSQPGPWTWPRVFLALAGALVAVLSAFAGDHAADPPALPARTADPPEPDAVELAKRNKGEP